MARRIEVEIIGDSRSLERAFARSSRSAKKFEGQLKMTGRSVRSGFQSFAAAAGVTVGVGALVTGLTKLTKSASDMQESMSKTNAVFGSSAASITDWSETTAKAFGVSQRQALETASSFGALFAPLGIVGSQAAEQSQKLTELGADLASFYNTDVQSALDAIRSGLVGEAEPLRRYGALLSETRVVEEALTQTHKKNASALTQQEKAMARVELIFRDTAIAQGDFARTSDGLAGQLKILQAQASDLAASLGTVLLPYVTNLVTKMNTWLSKTENQEKVLSAFKETVDKTAEAVNKLAEALEAAGNAGGWLKRQWDKLPDFGKDKGLAELTGIDIHTSLTDLLGAKTDLWRGGRGSTTVGDARSPDTRGYAATAKAIAAATTEVAKAVKKADDEIKKVVGPSATQRNRWFDAMIGRQLGRVQDVTTLKGQFARLSEIAALIRDRYNATRDITRRLALEDQLLDVYRQQRSINEALRDGFRRDAEAAKEAAKAAKEEAQAKREAAAAKRESARESAQFVALGLTAGGLERIPGAKALSGAAQRLGQALKGTILDTKSNRSMLKRIREVLSGELGAIGRTMRERIQQMIQDLRQQLGDLPKKAAPKRRRRTGIWWDTGPDIPQDRHVPSVISKFTDSVKEATVALSNLEKLRLFADLKQFGGNLWTRGGAVGMAGRVSSPGGGGGSRLTPLPGVSRGGGGTDASGIFGGGGRRTFGGVTVVQNFNAPTTDRHREARYALMATRTVFDS